MLTVLGVLGGWLALQTIFSRAISANCPGCLIADCPSPPQEELDKVEA
ncbi:MAG TPA: hypothetical protein VF239_10345 [Vicinamibacterales bacterium]